MENHINLFIEETGETFKFNHDDYIFYLSGNSAWLKITEHTFRFFGSQEDAEKCLKENSLELKFGYFNEPLGPYSTTILPFYGVGDEVAIFDMKINKESKKCSKNQITSRTQNKIT